MKKAFWIFVICVELVASLPSWGRQALDNSGNHPQNVALGQQGFQNPLPNYIAQPGYGHVDNTPRWPQQSDPRVNQFLQPSVVVPQTHGLNQYLPHQVFQQQQVLQNLPQYEKYVSPLVQATAPVQYGKPTNVQVLHENQNWLVQNYPNLQDTLARVNAPKLSSVQNSKYSAVAIATATAGKPSGSKGPVATLVPQTISPEFEKAICDANNGVVNARNIADKVLHILQLIIDAAKEAANAKAKNSDVNCKSTSSIPELNKLNKMYKEAQDVIKTSYSIFAALQDQVKYLVDKVNDNSNAPSYTSSLPPDSSNNEQVSNNEPLLDCQDQPNNENENQDTQEQTEFEEDEEPTNSEDEDCERENQETNV